MKAISFSLNGRRLEIDDASPNTTLLRYLREELHLTGTKEGCAEGDCGACTVVVIDPEHEAGPSFRAINSCLLLLPMLQGKSVFTVEALESGQAHHPVQESLVQALGSQCGYCTPGVVMSMVEACYRKDLDEPWKLDDQMCGNLCRCTGYRPIRDAAKSIAGLSPDDALGRALSSVESASMTLSYEHRGECFFTPDSFDALWALQERFPDARLIAGGTDMALEITKRFERLPLLISVEGIAELRREAVGSGGWTIGAAVPLAKVESLAKDRCPPIERMLRFFGSRQIKNRGTIGGNLCTASPIGDMAPVLLALDAKVELRSKAGPRTIGIDDLFVGYRKTALRPGELMSSVTIPPLAPGDVRACAYKVSKRQELDISTVSAGMLVELDSGVVKRARFAFGGMAATPSRAAHLESALLGKPWTEATVEAALPEIDRDFTPIDDHRGSAWYRRTVAKNLVLGFFLETQSQPTPSLAYRPTGTVNPELPR